VVIPTYKRTTLLYRCLVALGKQNFPRGRYEVIVISDGPDPETAWLFESGLPIGQNIIYCPRENKWGPAAARNAGWMCARSELVLFTDDDCIPAEDWLANYYGAWRRLLQRHPRQGVPGPEAAFRGSVTVPRCRRPTDYEKNTACLETAGFVTANCAVTKAALDKLGGFDESFTMAWREDSDLEFRLLQNNVPVIFVPDARIIHPVRHVPWGISMKEQKKSLFNALLYKKHPLLFRTRIYSRPFINYYVSVSLAILAGLFLVVGNDIWSLVFALGWLLLTVDFARRRLRGTSHSASHVVEMLVTSAAIPFLSVYWTLYGSFRYKTFFL